MLFSMKDADQVWLVKLFFGVVSLDARLQDVFARHFRFLP